MPKKFLDKKYCSWCGGILKKKTEQELVCKSCSTTEFSTPKAAVGAMIFNDEGQMLVATRTLDPGEGLLDVPGGFVEPGESAEQATIRELKEETGLFINEESLHIAKTNPNTYLYQGKLAENVDILFTLKIKTGTKTTASDDVRSLEWLMPKDIDFDKFWSQQLAESIRSYLQKQNML